MTSTSVLGVTQITLQFDLTATSTAPRGDVQAAINAPPASCRRRCPSPPTFRKVNPSDAPIMILAAQSDADADLTEVDDYADNILAQQISQIDGVGQVLIGGQQKRAVRVQVDPGEARRDGHDAGGRPQRAGHATVNTPKGSIDGDRSSLHDLRQRPAHATPRQYNNSSSAYRNGAPIRVQRHRPGGRRAGEPRTRRPGRTASAASC